MEDGIKHPWFLILACAFIVLNGALSFFTDERRVWTSIKVATALVMLVPLIRTLMYSHYIMYKEGVIIWNRIYAGSLNIAPQEIALVRLDQRPFRRSQIILQNGKHLSLEHRLISNSTLRTFFSKAGVEFEG